MTVFTGASLKIPTLGICFGGQFLADLFGGEVVRDHDNEEQGSTEIYIAKRARWVDAVFQELPRRITVQSSHHDRIARLPKSARKLAWSRRGKVTQAFKMEDMPVWGLQFHPERAHADSPYADRVLERFFAI